MEPGIPGLVILFLVASFCSALPDFHIGGSGESRIGGNITAHGSSRGVGTSVGAGVGTDLKGRAGLNNYTVEGNVGGALGGETGVHAGIQEGLKGTVNGTGVADYYGSVEGRRLKNTPAPNSPGYQGALNTVPFNYGAYPAMPGPYPYMPSPGMPAPYPYVPNSPMQGPYPYYPNLGMPSPYGPISAPMPGQYPYAPNTAIPNPYPYQGQTNDEKSTHEHQNKSTLPPLTVNNASLQN